MRGAINWFVIRIINSLDDIRLFAHAGIGKNRVRRSQIFQVSLKRTDVSGWTVRNILRNAERVGDLLNGVQPGKLSNAYAHGVARVDQAIGARTNSAVRSIGISRRPISSAVDFTRLDRTVTDRSARQ